MPSRTRPQESHTPQVDLKFSIPAGKDNLPDVFTLGMWPRLLGLFRGRATMEPASYWREHGDHHRDHDRAVPAAMEPAGYRREHPHSLSACYTGPQCCNGAHRLSAGAWPPPGTGGLPWQCRHGGRPVSGGAGAPPPPAARARAVPQGSPPVIGGSSSTPDRCLSSCLPAAMEPAGYRREQGTQRIEETRAGLPQWSPPVIDGSGPANPAAWNRACPPQWSPPVIGGSSSCPAESSRPAPTRRNGGRRLSA